MNESSEEQGGQEQQSAQEQAQETTQTAEDVVKEQATTNPSPVEPLPTVGRIVHYTPQADPRGERNKGQPYAAVITHVWGPEVVNLHVFNDGSFPLWDSDANRPTSVQRGTGQGTWSWPPRN